MLLKNCKYKCEKTENVKVSAIPPAELVCVLCLCIHLFIYFFTFNMIIF